MDFRAQDYLNKLFNEEFEKTLEKRMFNLGMAWGYYMFIEQFRKSAGGGSDAKRLADDWLSEMSKEKTIGQYIKEIVVLTENEMTPSEKIIQEMSERYHT